MWVFDKLNELINNALISIITGSLTGMFDKVNSQVGTISTNVAQSPLNWNSDIYSFIKSISDVVIIPIAGLIITYVLCYELITTVAEKNNMHEFETFIFFKFVLKAFIAIYLVSHTLDIATAIFDVGKYAITKAGTVITGTATTSNIDISSTVANEITQLQTYDTGKLIQIVCEVGMLSFMMSIMSVIITVVLYGRMLEIYLYLSIAPIPFATMTNREWGSIGNSYLKGLFALAFQGLFLLLCVGMYSVLVTEAQSNIGTDFDSTLFKMLAMAVILCVLLLKSGSISKSIFNAH